MKLISAILLLFPALVVVHAWIIRTPRAPRHGIALSFSNDPELLKQKAAQLREEIASFEQEKMTVAERERQTRAQAQAEAMAQRERYSAVVPILKPDGQTVMERCDFRPYWKEPICSFIIVIEAMLPLGILLGESEEIPGAVVVDEVAPSSNGAQAGLRVGDLVRACTACRMEMVQPTWQLMVGGIGQPKTVRFMYSIDPKKPFEEVMEAIASNRMDPEQRSVLLVVERKETESK
jgi:hypothetical protein